MHPGSKQGRCPQHIHSKAQHGQAERYRAWLESAHTVGTSPDVLAWLTWRHAAVPRLLICRPVSC
jgi:hypothetical protein